MNAVILDPDYRDVIRYLEENVYIPNMDLHNVNDRGWVRCDLSVNGLQYTYRTLYSPDEGFIREIVNAEGCRVWAIVYPDNESLHPCYAPTLKSQPFLPSMPIDDRLDTFRQSIEDGIINNIYGYMGYGWCIFQLEAGWTVDPVYLKCKYGASMYYLITLVQCKNPNFTKWKTVKCKWNGRIPVRKRGSLCNWFS